MSTNTKSRRAAAHKPRTVRRKPTTIQAQAPAKPAAATRGPVPCCEVCGWTLAESRDKGCVQGDCSYRPTDGTDEWYRIRARREALAAAATKRAGEERDGNAT